MLRVVKFIGCDYKQATIILPVLNHPSLSLIVLHYTTSMDEDIHQYLTGLQTTDLQKEETQNSSNPTVEQVQTMAAYLSGRQTAQQAAQSLTHIVVDATSLYVMDSRMRALWTFINRTAIALLNNQGQLIQLLGQIRTCRPSRFPKRAMESTGLTWRTMRLGHSCRTGPMIGLMPLTVRLYSFFPFLFSLKNTLRCPEGNIPFSLRKLLL